MRLRAIFLLAAMIGVLTLGGPQAAAQRGLPDAEEFRQRAGAHAAEVRADILLADERGRARAAARCATGGLTPTERALLDAGVTARTAAAQTLRQASVSNNVVRVAFHVVHDGDTGLLDLGQVRKQIRVLRKAFRSSKFRFRLYEVTYTDKRKWFTKCQRQKVWQQMTRQLAADPERFLNIYSCRPQSFLGAAYLPGPWSGQHWDGVVVLHSTLPGGSAAPYDLGDTVVHEVGHYLGLDHTFYNGCNSPGDAVDDTPFEARPDYACAVGRDTCPQPGTDPVENFMDYGPDRCLREFTPGQRDRMHEQVAAYRPEI